MTMHRGSELMVIDFDDKADGARRCDDDDDADDDDADDDGDGRGSAPRAAHTRPRVGLRQSTSEPTMSIQRFSRKNGGKAKVAPLSTGSEMTAAAVIGFRSLTPIMRGKKVSSI
jgi:hypothetical protein